MHVLPNRQHTKPNTQESRDPQPSEPPDADLHVRWCGRGSADDSLTPMPIISWLEITSRMGNSKALWDNFQT